MKAIKRAQEYRGVDKMVDGFRDAINYDMKGEC